MDEDRELEILKILHEEWRFRLSQYWSITIKIKTFCFALIFMPFVYVNLGIDKNLLPFYLFPITGAILSVVSCIVETVEMNKINALKNSIRDRVQNMTPIFTFKVHHNWFHHHIPILICSIQIVLALIIIIFVKW